MPSQSRTRALVLIGFIAIVGVGTSIALTTPPAANAAVGGCAMFPPDNIWNTRVDNLPIHPQSSAYISAIGAAVGLHPDFGAGYWDGKPIGMFYTTVYSPQASVAINYVEYGNESDPGPFPIPLDAPVEGGSWLTNTGDRHVLVVNTYNCVLYELYHAYAQANRWDAGSGAVFTLTANAPLRPDTWTSADAAGLPILPGLARYDEAASGVITHALRFTTNCTSGYIWPARHEAPSGSCANPPPMGLRVRLKSSFVINAGWSPQTKAILTALKRYGMILADNGSRWYISGAHDPGWDDDALISQLWLVKGSDFEAVDASVLMLNYNSGQAKQLLPRLWIPVVSKQ